MLEVTTSYSYNQKTNSIDIEFSQKPVSKKNYEENPHFKIKDLYDDESVSRKVEIVDFNARAVRYFDTNLNVVIFQTNGVEVIKECHTIKLENEKNTVNQNYLLNTKIRKPPIKKREQGNYNFLFIYINFKYILFFSFHFILIQRNE